MTDMDGLKKGFKNYVILIVIFLLGICLTLYLCKWYKVYDDYQKEIPVIRDSLLEITYDDLDHYLMENPSTVIYMCTASWDACRSYEKEFKKLIEKKELKDTIIYLNLSDLDQEKFVNDFNNKFNFKNKLTTNYPAFVIFRDGEISQILQGRKNKKLTIGNTKQFLELNEISEDE